MWIEQIIADMVKNTSKKYLRFQSNENISLPENKKDKKYLLYVHIPFCETLCPYCSFNRYLFEPAVARDYFTALRQELKIYRDHGYDCQGVYVGGGTPTILLDELCRTIELIKRLYSLGEISVETNPNHLTERKIGALKQMGVNRISVGVQSFDDRILKAIERYETYGSGQELKERLKLTLGRFDTVNADMIFNFPMQTMEMLERDIDSLIEIKIDQVTFYPLMASSPDTKALSEKRGKIDYQKEKIFYFKILERLSDYLEPNTAWCFSKNGSMIDEYIVNYDEYIGLGSGSFGYLNGSMYVNAFSLQQYIDRLQGGQLPIAFKKRFSKKEQMRYDFLMQLFGGRFNIKTFNEKHSDNFYKHMWKEVMFFEAIGGIKRKNDHIFLTRKGMYYWVIMMREFFTGVNTFRDYCRKLTGE